MSLARTPLGQAAIGASATGAALLLAMLMGLYDSGVAVADPAAGVGVIVALRGRLAGALGVALAFALHGAAMGGGAVEAVCVGLLYGFACYAAGRFVSLAHHHGLTASRGREWMVLFFLGAWPLTAIVALGRWGLHMAPMSEAVGVFALIVEAMGNIIGVMATVSVLGQLKRAGGFQRFTRIETLFIFGQALMVLGYWAFLRYDIGLGSNSAVVMLLGVPLSIAIAMSTRTLPAGLLSSVTIFICIAIGLHHEGSAVNPEFVLSQVFFVVLLISGQLVHQINGDRLDMLEINLRHNAELEDRVAARTAELQAMTQRALAADEAKSEFLAVVSHELRTPMNGVMGMSELLDETALDERQRMFVNVIRSSGHALLAMINDILDFSRIDAGRLELDEAVFEVTELGGEHLTPLALAAREKGLCFTVRLDPTLPARLIGDVARLRQVMINFLGNAVKFTETGEVRLEIERCGDALRIAVIDSGCGVPEAQRGAIFDKFSQADTSATRRHQGAGLGLAICKGLAEAMGGSVGVGPAPEGGSVFWLEAPLRAAAAQTLRQRVGDDLSGLRVMLCDGDPRQAAIAREVIETMGATCLWARDRAQAVEMAQAGDYDLAVYSHDLFGPEAGRFGDGLSAPGLCVIDIVDDASGREEAPLKPYRPSALAAALRRIAARIEQTDAPVAHRG